MSSPVDYSRWFLALRPPGLAESPVLKDIVKKLRRTFDQKGWEAVWVKPELWHVTAHFLGSLSPERVAEVRKVAESVARSAPALELELRGVGAFPEIHEGRVVWVGVVHSRELVALQRQLMAQLLEEGLVGENQADYRPHLTLARLRNVHHLKDAVSPVVRRQVGSFPVAELLLMRSEQVGHLTRHGVDSAFPLGTVSRP